MKRLEIDNNLSNICPDIKLGCIEYFVNVEAGNSELWNEITDQMNIIKKSLTLDDIIKIKNITDSRNLYKKIGKNPYKYRVSSEALLRRIIQGKGLYKINNVVDANNLISIKSYLSVGSYDIDKLGEHITFRIGEKEESYKGIGKGIINVENLPVFSDEFGVYGSPTSDSDRALISNKTKNALTVLISFSNNSGIEKYLEEAVEIFKTYVGARKINSYIIKGKNKL